MFFAGFLFISTHISLDLLSLGSAEAYVGWGGKLNSHLTASCVRNIHTKNYQNRKVSFQDSRKCLGYFLRHSVLWISGYLPWRWMIDRKIISLYATWRTNRGMWSQWAGKGMGSKVIARLAVLRIVLDWQRDMSLIHARGHPARRQSHISAQVPIHSCTWLNDGRSKNQLTADDRMRVIRA